MDEIDDFYSSLALDLEAFFKMMLSDVIQTLDDAKDLSPDDIIHEITKVI